MALPERGNDMAMLDDARKIMARVASDMWCCGDGHGSMCIGCHSVFPGSRDKHSPDCFVRHAQVWLQKYDRGVR